MNTEDITVINVRDENAPHQAIIRVTADVYELHETGKCIPPMSRLYNKNYVLVGKDFKDLKTKVNDFLEVFEDAKTEYEQNLSEGS